MHVDDKELLKMQQQGAKIISRTPAEKPPAPPESDAEKIISAINALGATIANQEPPTIEVDVAAPKVEVHPQIKVEGKKEYRVWDVEILERDKTADQRLKKFRITAVE